MSRLHLIYSGTYNNNNNHKNLNDNRLNEKLLLKFGDNALNGNVIFQYNKKKELLTLGMTIIWNIRLMNYYKNQIVGVKCILYEKYPEIKSQSILFDGILNKKDNKIIWSPKKFPLKHLYSNICWKVRLAIPATTDFEYIPTIQEIKQEISKLSEEQIEKERKEYNEYLKNTNPWLICESLEEKISNFLIEKKKSEKKFTNDIKIDFSDLKQKKKKLQKKFTNDIKNDFSDF